MSLLSKIGKYEIELQVEKVKVSVVDAKINELQSSLKALPRHVVGLDVKIVPIESTKYSGSILILCVGTCSLVIQVCYLDRFPCSLLQSNSIRKKQNKF